MDATIIARSIVIRTSMPSGTTMKDIATSCANDSSRMNDRLVSIWERVLQRSPIPHHENFFDLGGDSLLAVSLFLEIEREMGRSLPITAIYDAPTLATMGALLEQPSIRAFTPLILLKSGVGKPIFIVHGLGGTVIELSQLGMLIRTQRPVYAIQAKGVDGSEEPFDSIASMADYYLDTIREIQFRGPYILAGYSFGGVVAFEMARRLSAEGEEIALLALLDSYTHPRSWPRNSRLSVWWRKACRRISVTYALRRISNAARNLRAYGGLHTPRSLPAALQRVRESCSAALAHYEPCFYPGKVTFLRAETVVRYPSDPRKVWSHLARELEVHTVSGEHVDLVRAHVDSLAAGLSLCLERVADPG
jgi:acetoacetyl-CoA synthetase